MIDILVTCGSMKGDIDPMVPQFVSNVIRAFQIIIPIILIILGMVDLGKAVTSNDEKQMKEAQKTLIKRVIYALLIFFLIAIVKFVFSMVSDSDAKQGSKGISGCIDCFLNYSSGNCSGNNNNDD